MSTNTRTRKTVAGAYAEVESLRTEMRDGFAAILAAINADAPAKTAPAKKAAPKRTRKAAPKAQPKAATKGSRAVGHGSGLSRKGWNQTLSAKARLSGGDTYKRVVADWAEVQTLRNAGATPDEVLALYTR